MSGVQFPLGPGIFSPCPDQLWGQPGFLFEWVPVALSLRVKWPGCEADHSASPSAEVKNVWSYTFIPPLCLHGVVLN
jgi:hypothetical protein